MRTAKAKSFLEHQLPEKYLSMLPQAVENAYSAVEALANDEPILKVESARINRGHVRAWAVDLAVERLVKSGKWPFDCGWTNYGRPTGKWLRVRLEASTMSISQVQNRRQIPRRALFRTNNVLNNMPFLDIDGFKEEQEIRGLPHFLMSHGYQGLEFVHIGLPYPMGSNAKGYIYQTPNLLKRVRVIQSDLPPVEGQDAEAVVELLEELKKWWHDNGKQ